MTYYTVGDAQQAARESLRGTFAKAEAALRNTPLRDSYDIFLSHSFQDAELVLGVKKLLETGGRSVYVDWIDDYQLDRSKVDSSTASLLRRRMQQSRSFVYAYSVASTHSKWMPWELGYFDGLRDGKQIAVMPLTAYRGDSVAGQEYLGLYAPIERQAGAYADSPIVKRFGGFPPRSLSEFAGR